MTQTNFFGLNNIIFDSLILYRRRAIIIITSVTPKRETITTNIEYLLKRGIIRKWNERVISSFIASLDNLAPEAKCFGALNVMANFVKWKSFLSNKIRSRMKLK